VKVRSVLAGTLLFLLSPVSSISLRAQDTAPVEQPQSEFFSGVVTALAGDTLTVSKALLGKNTETRKFAITAETRVEGRLRVKARVTVRYVHDDEVDRALHIIVRASQKK